MSEYPQSQPTSPEAGHRGSKSPSAFRTISEVARELDVPQHVLRFWESKFSQVKPLKRGGGRRYYRPEDVELLRNIRTLLYRDGYTIKGVQKLLREGQVARGTDDTAATPARTVPNGKAGRSPVAPDDRADMPEVVLAPAVRHEIESVIAELTALRSILRG